MKHLKSIFVLVCTLCVALGIGLLAACGGSKDPTPTPTPDPSDVTYTVTVTCDNSTILGGIKVKMTPASGDPTEAALSDGKASFTLPAGTYTASLVETMEGILTGYTYAPQTLTATSPNATIALTAESSVNPGPGGETKETVNYKVTVKLPNGTSAAHLAVQLCGGPVYTCHVAETDQYGVVSYDLEPGEYEVHIESVQPNFPKGYVFDNSKYTMGSEGGELIVELEVAQEYTVTVVYAGNLLTGAEERPAAGLTVALFEETNDQDNGKQYATEAFCSAKTNDEGVATLYAFGGDHVYVARITDCPIEYGYQNTITVEATAPAIKLELTELGTGLYNTITVGVGTYTVNITADRKEYFYDFDPAGKAGYYRISSSGTYTDENGNVKDVDAKVERYTGTFAFVNATPEEECDDISDTNVHFSMDFCVTPEEITADGMGNKWIFKVSALATIFGSETRPFQITFEYLREYVAPTQKTETPNAQEAFADDDWTADYDQPADTAWEWLQPGVSLVKDANGVYHFGSAAGPIVFAAVTGSKYIPQGMDANFAAAMAQGNTAFQYSTGIADDNNVITTYLLTALFTDYANAANDDGLHPLTEELKLVLQAYSTHNGIYAADDLNWDRDSDQLFLFACGYFKSNYATPLSGQGTADEPYLLNGENAYGTYKFTMPASGKLYFATRLGGTVTFSCDATLTIGGTTYTKDQTASFEANTSHTNFDFALAAGSELIFVFAPELGSEGNPIKWQMGENTVNVPESKVFDGVWYSYTPESDGLYEFSTDHQSAAIESPEGYFDRFEGEGSAVFELLAGRTYYFLCSIADGKPVSAYTVQVKKALTQTTASGTGSSDSPFGIIEEGWYRVQTNEQDGVYGQYFAYNARTEGNWQIKCYSPNAQLLFFAPNDKEGVSYSLGSDQVFFTINIKTTLETTGVYTILMGAPDFAVYTYYFYFGEVKEAEPAPGPGTGGDVQQGDLVVGSNSITVTDVWNGTSKTFVAPESGTYEFSITSPNASIGIEGDYGFDPVLDLTMDMDTYSVQLNAGASITFLCFTNNYAVDTYTLTIEKTASTGGGQGGTGGDVQQGDLVVGSNSITVTNAFDGTSKTFVAPESGTYEFSITSPNANIGIEGDYGFEPVLDLTMDMDTYSVYLNAGASITFLCFTNNNAVDTYTLTIEKVEGAGGGSVQSELIVGANTIECGEWGGNKTFVASEEGTYTFSITSKTIQITVDGNTVIDGPANHLTYTVHLAAGQSIKLVYFSATWQAETFVLTIAKA